MAENLLADREEVEVIVANGARRRHPRFTNDNIDKTLALQEIFPNLMIRYDELPYRKLKLFRKSAFLVAPRSGARLVAGLGGYAQAA